MSLVGFDHWSIEGVFTHPAMKVFGNKNPWIPFFDKNIMKQFVKLFFYMGVSKNRGIPKWMVYNGSKPY